MLSGKNPLLIALALGLAAGVVAWLSIKGKERKIKDRWQTVNVLCAKVDVPEGGARVDFDPADLNKNLDRKKGEVKPILPPGK